jgi:chaperonin cofactor prefoldin
MPFITQRGEVGMPEVSEPPMTELSELEALVSGINQVSQSTLLLKKMKEMSEVDDSLEYMKEQFSRRMSSCEERERAFQKRQAEMKEQVWRAVMSS